MRTSVTLGTSNPFSGALAQRACSPEAYSTHLTIGITKAVEPLAGSNKSSSASNKTAVDGREPWCAQLMTATATIEFAAMTPLTLRRRPKYPFRFNSSPDPSHNNTALISCRANTSSAGGSGSSTTGTRGPSESHTTGGEHADGHPEMNREDRALPPRSSAHPRGFDDGLPFLQPVASGSQAGTRDTQAPIAAQRQNPPRANQSPLLNPVNISAESAGPSGHGRTPNVENDSADAHGGGLVDPDLDQEWLAFLGIQQDRARSQNPGNPQPLPEPPPAKDYPGPPQTHRGLGKKTKKAALKIAALDIKGQGHTAREQNLEVNET
ncbi:hypothetical protein B0H19DRAFT_1372387 [Mycena capillaripes]|nr:hypothetical protein B0H19DRAFT_1372387 [Mycena capillaripes]